VSAGFASSIIATTPTTSGVAPEVRPKGLPNAMSEISVAVTSCALSPGAQTAIRGRGR
jgi:hypothetical protein